MPRKSHKGKAKKIDTSLVDVSAFSVVRKNISKKSKNKNRKKQSDSNKEISISDIENVVGCKIGDNIEKISLKDAVKVLPNKKKEKLPPNLNVSNNVKIDREQPVLNVQVNGVKSKKIKRKQDNLPKFLNKKKKAHLENTESELEESDDEFDVCSDSKDEGKKVLEWLIAPHPLDTFLSKYWEKKPLHISRKNDKYYKAILSVRGIDKMLRKDFLKFTENIDITSYDENGRQTHNPVGRALPHVVWDFYLNNCSIRVLNPQTYIPRIHTLNAALQEFFNCFVGANVYLTPPDSQGFAPHYDDIEAFVIQLEGKKLWKIYAPVSDNEVLPRVSSKNYDQSEIGDPVMEVVLEAGDLLYFPRGFIHQASTIKGEYSLHVTISTYQKHSWCDFFEKMLPQALEIAIQNDVELRKGVPLDLYENLGLVHADSQTPRRIEIQNHIKNLFGRICKHLPVDSAADQLYKDYIHAALPPVIPESERQLTVFGDTDRMTNEGEVKNRVEIQLDTEIKLIRSNILRMVAEEDAIRIYYSVENSKIFHGSEPQFLEIDESMAPAVETLINMYPEFVTVEQLDIESDSDKLQIVTDLWEKGLIKCKYPLEYIDDSS